MLNPLTGSRRSSLHTRGETRPASQTGFLSSLFVLRDQLHQFGITYCKQGVNQSKEKTMAWRFGSISFHEKLVKKSPLFFKALECNKINIAVLI